MTRARTVALGIGLALVLLALGGCCNKSGSNGVPSWLQPEGKGEVVATINGMNIYMDEFKDRMEKQSPYIRSRYDSLDKKKEFLENMVKFELLAQEAAKRGYDKDAEVLRAAKQVMTQRLMREDFEEKIKQNDISEADKQKFFEEHKSEYNKPAMRRASHILIKVNEGASEKDWAAAQKKAQQVLKEVKATKPDDPNAFRDLVTKYSDDEANKTRGGDLGYFAATAEGGPMAQEFSDATFAIANVNDVAGPVRTKFGWHVIRLTGVRDKIERTYEQVKGQIEHRLFKDLRTKKYDEFMENLRKSANVTINDNVLNAYNPASVAKPGEAPNMMGNPGDPSAPKIQAVPIPAPTAPAAPNAPAPAPAGK